METDIEQGGTFSAPGMRPIFQIDPIHSSVQFRVRYLGFSHVIGRFDRFSGTIRMVPGHVGTVYAEVRIEASSINTGDATRDAHLRSTDFLGAGQYPEIHFVSTGVSDLAVNGLRIEGNLTIRGTTLPVTLETEFLGEIIGPDGLERMAFEARTLINRYDYGLSWNSVLETGNLLLGDEVDIQLAVQAVRKHQTSTGSGIPESR